MHWTYESIKDPTSDLEQGDIIAPTDDLRGVLRRIHSHFDDDKYLSYCIATQSCDLVRRGTTGKAKYISIAAVRSLKAVFPALFAEMETPIAPDIFRQKSKDKARQLLTRILNQNEQSLGLFYLYPDEGTGLGESAIAYLRVTVALKSDHYGTLVAARRGRLTSEFRSKFGWLLGNLYSRSATRDWDDDEFGKQGLKKLIAEHLGTGSQDAEKGLFWLPDDLASVVQSKQIDISDVPREQLIKTLQPHLPPSAFDSVVEEVVDAAKEALKISPADPKLAPFRARLNSLKKFIK